MKYDVYVEKKPFCSFVDFKKAFETVWRNGLWRTLIKNGINGKWFHYKIKTHGYGSQIFVDAI